MQATGTPIPKSSKDRLQDIPDGSLTDSNCESGHRANIPDGNWSTAEVPEELPRKITKPREYQYLNVLTGDFADKLIIST